VQHIIKTNFCDIGFALHSDGNRLILVSCLDNLGKRCGWPSRTEPESHAGTRGKDGARMRIVVKFAGALLEDAATVRFAFPADCRALPGTSMKFW